MATSTTLLHPLGQCDDALLVGATVEVDAVDVCFGIDAGIRSGVRTNCTLACVAEESLLHEIPSPGTRGRASDC